MFLLFLIRILPFVITDMALLRRLVDVEPAWAVLTLCLTSEDALALYIIALDHDHLQLLAHSLLYDVETVNFAKERRLVVLHCAAAHGCVRAVRRMMYGRRGTSGKSLQGYIQQYAPSMNNSRTKIMHWLNTFRPYLYPEDVMYTAASRGDIETVEWLHSTCNYEPHRAMELAASKGHLGITQWLYEQQRTALIRGDPSRHRHVKITMRVPFGEINLMHWIVNIPGKRLYQHQSERALFRSSRNRRRICFATPRELVVDWFSAEQPPPRDRSTLDTFRRSSGKWELREDLDSDISIDGEPAYDGPWFAAKRGDLDLLKQLHEDREYGWQWTPMVMDTASSNGHLGVVIWLHTNRHEGCTTDAMDNAAKHGHMSVIQWLHANRSEGPSAKAVQYAALSGHLIVVEWLYSHYPQYTITSEMNLEERTNSKAFIKVLRWLHARDPQSFAIKARHLVLAVKARCDVEDLEWLRQQWLLSNASMQYQWTLPDDSTQLDVEKYLADHHKAPLDRILNMAVWHDQRDIFEYFANRVNIKEKKPITVSSLLLATSNQRWELVDDVIQADMVAWSPIPALTCSFVAGPDSKQHPANLLSPFLTHRQRRSCIDPSVQALMCKLATMNALSFSNPRYEVSVAVWAAQRGYLVLARFLLDRFPQSIACLKVLKALMQYTKGGYMIQAILEESPALLNGEVVKWAAKYNQVGLLDFIARQNRGSGKWQSFTRTVIVTACQHGQVNVLQWVYQLAHIQFRLWHNAAQLAAMRGQVNALQWIFQHPHIARASGFTEVAKLANSACRCGHLHALRWLLMSPASKKVQLSLHKRLVRVAMGRGYVEIVAWLASYSRQLTENDPEIVSELLAFQQKWAGVL